MKRTHFLLTLVLSVCTITASFAQTADEIAKSYLDAKGGADKIKAINDLTMTGNLTINGIKIPLTIKVVNGKAMRVDFSFNGMTGYQIITETQGWNFNPFQGQTAAEPMTDDDVKSSQDQLDATDDLLDYAAKGSTVEYLGKDDVEGTEAHKLKITFKSGKEKTMFISTADYVLLKASEKLTVNGQEVENTTSYSNYKKVNDVMIAHTQFSSIQGEVEFDTVEVNKNLDLAIFKP